MIVTLLSILLYISSILMIIVVLLQPHKSEGAISTESTVFGLAIDGGPLVRITWALAITITLSIIGIHYFA